MDIKKVKIIRNNLIYTSGPKEAWYSVGNIFEVRDYRHNSREYWELSDWRGDMRWHDGNYWIKKEHTEIINVMNTSWIDELFN